MLPILIACLVWLPALIGLGTPLAVQLRRINGAIVGSIAIHSAICGLLGMFVASTLAAAANFFVGVYPIVSTGILLLGWTIFVLHRRRWTRLPRRAWVTFSLTTLVVTLIDARGMQWYDTGLYHLQAVQWLTHGPVPAGLANLYECLGYNCSWFTFAAAVETPLLLGKSCFVVNALLGILIALPAVDGLIRLKSNCVLLALMLIPLAQFTVDVPMMSSLSPDPVVMLLVLLSVVLWMRSSRFAAYTLVFGCFAITVKLSALPLLILALIATGKRILRLNRVLGFCGLAAIIFLVRGIWLSGYAAYPAAISRISGLSWTAPSSVALHAAKEIAYWSRYGKVFERVAPGTPWVAAWCRRVATTKPMLIAAGLLIIGIVLFTCRRPGIDRRCVAAMLALLPAIAFWFFTAPQVRFGYGYLFALASLAFSQGIRGLTLPKNKTHFAALAVFPLLLAMRIDRHFLKISLINWPEIPIALLDTHQTADGIIIHTPRGDDRVWNAPVPCTTDVNANLHCVLDSHARIRAWYIDSSGLKPAR